MIDPILFYLGHKLTSAPQDYIDERELARQKVEEVPAFKALRFKGLVAAKPGEVYDYDIGNCVAKADVLVIDLSLDSNGSTAEFVEGVRVLQKPALILFEASIKPSRLITDYEVKFPELVTVRRYRSIRQEILPLVIEKIELHPHLLARYTELMRQAA